MKRILLITPLAVLAGCEKMDIGTIPDEGAVPVVIHLSVEDDAATRSVIPVSEVCERVNLAVFQGDTKVKNIIQKAGDDGFGDVALSLSPGEYTVVAIGHNCAGSATISSPAKVTFPGNKVTDTFSYCEPLTVESDGIDAEIQMSRAVAMVRIKDAGGLPEGAESLKFYYVGCSSTFSPQGFCGIVNSKQTELRPSDAAGEYELYTFPHTEDDEITKMVVTALNGSGVAVKETTLENIPVAVNKVTT